MQKHPCDPNLELDGNTVQAWFNSLTSENYQHILAKNGLQQLDAQQWYRLRGLLDTLEEIAAQSGGMMDLVAIGMAAAENSLIPPEVAAMPVYQFYKIYEKVYLARHRNGDPGRLEAEVVNDHHVVMTLNTPYPDDLMYGLFYGYARRLSPKGQRFVVEYDDEQPRIDRGGSVTIYHIRWE